MATEQEANEVLARLMVLDPRVVATTLRDLAVLMLSFCGCDGRDAQAQEMSARLLAFEVSSETICGPVYMAMMAQRLAVVVEQSNDIIRKAQADSRAS